MQQARLLEEQISDVEGLLRHVAAARATANGEAYKLELVEERPDEIVDPHDRGQDRPGHHPSRPPRGARRHTSISRLADVHRELDALTGTPPFTIRLGETPPTRARSRSCTTRFSSVAQRGIDYYRFKGLGEMDAEELRETTMDPATRTLVQVTMEDAASADLVFSMLMGDQVEPRRAFIEENARLVTNLDV